MNADPVEDFLDQLRPWLMLHEHAFRAGVVTGLEITARMEEKHRRHGWQVTVKPETCGKVLEAWSVDAMRVRAIK